MLTEWMAIVEGDPSLHLMPIKDDEGNVWMEDPDKGSAAFKLSSGEWWPLWWEEGRVYTKNPPKPFFVKLDAIADTLGARLQGDDGEFYDSEGQVLPELTETTKPKNSLLGRLFGRNRD